MLSFFPRGVLDEILNLIVSVSEDFPSYSYNIQVYILEQTPQTGYNCIQFMLLAVIISSVILLVNIIVISSNTSTTSIFMLTLLYQIELEV